MDLLLNKETNDNTHVFTKGIGSPRCASIIYDCLKNLKSKVNEIYKFSSSSKGISIKGSRQLEEVCEAIKFITENLKKTENKRKKKQQN